MSVFETPGSVSLQIKLPSGRVVVTTVDEPRTSVELVSLGRRGPDAIDDVSVTADEHHGRHLIRIEQRDRIRWGPIQITWGSDIETRITCPPGSDLELSGGSTDLRVEGDLGDVTVRTASGDARLETARGKLVIKTASGDISVATSMESGIEAVRIRAAGRVASFDVRLRLGLDPSISGWRYRTQLLKVGGAITFATDRYIMRGTVLAISTRGETGSAAAR